MKLADLLELLKDGYYDYIGMGDVAQVLADEGALSVAFAVGGIVCALRRDAAVVAEIL